MKSLSDPAVHAVSRRQLLINYFSARVVPSLSPGDNVVVEVRMSGLLGAERSLHTYTHDEVMHVLGEMWLRGLPFKTQEDLKREQDEEWRKVMNSLPSVEEARSLAISQKAARDRALGTITTPKSDPTAKPTLLGALSKFFSKT